MKVANVITTILLIFTSIATNVLPAQSTEVSSEFNTIVEASKAARKSKDNEDLQCLIAATVYVNLDNLNSQSSPSVSDVLLGYAARYITSACKSKENILDAITAVKSKPELTTPLMQLTTGTNFIKLAGECSSLGLKDVSELLKMK